MKKLLSTTSLMIVIIMLLSQQAPMSNNLSINREPFVRKLSIKEENKQLIDSMNTMFQKMDSSSFRLKCKLNKLKTKQRYLINQVDTLEMLSTLNY